MYTKKSFNFPFTLFKHIAFQVMGLSIKNQNVKIRLKNSKNHGEMWLG